MFFLCFCLCFSFARTETSDTVYVSVSVSALVFAVPMLLSHFFFIVLFRSPVDCEVFYTDRSIAAVSEVAREVCLILLFVFLFVCSLFV